MYKSNRIESSNQSSNLFHTYIHVSQHVSHKYVCQLAVFRKKKVDCHVFYLGEAFPIILLFAGIQRDILWIPDGQCISSLSFY